jgi:hypothetical protein
MKLAIAAVGSAAVLGLAACSTTTINPPAPAARSSSPSSPASSAAPGPTVTKTRIKRQAVPVQSPAPAQSQVPAPSVTDPWAVVSAYYGDIESGNYAEAWALVSSGAVTGQDYQQFVAGFACTGSQELSEIAESGDQVTFRLAATDDCTGVVQHFTGTDTVINGKIAAADVHQTG